MAGADTENSGLNATTPSLYTFTCIYREGRTRRPELANFLVCALPWVHFGWSYFLINQNKPLTGSFVIVSHVEACQLRVRSCAPFLFLSFHTWGFNLSPIDGNACLMGCNPTPHLEWIHVCVLNYAGVSAGVCSVESLSIFETQRSFRLIIIFMLLFLSLASSPGNQTNWWWCGPAGVAGNPPRSVLKQTGRTFVSRFLLPRLISVLCPTVPQLAAWHQKPLQGRGGVACAGEHRDHRHPF